MKLSSEKLVSKFAFHKRVNLSRYAAVLFNDTIYYNIAYGRENHTASEAEVHEAGLHTCNPVDTSLESAWPGSNP